ncbi:MAG: lipopolysaccharide transport periplasmic protein LptA [Parvibaculum sp.]|nr:lipopolysaccharide transport periplasmic protein LptA [Parvibaculum sp.]
MNDTVSWGLMDHQNGAEMSGFMTGGRFILALGLLVAGLTLGITGATHAAENAKPMEGFATDPNEPIEIEADTLEVEDKSSQATFIGNVVAIQGETRLRADRLKATYAAGPDGGKTQIRTIVATGRVHVLSKDDQSADGDWARYNVATREIVMGDQVVLRQGKNVIRGTQLFIDLNSGLSRVTGGTSATIPSESGNGRVKALFQPSSDANK